MTTHQHTCTEVGRLNGEIKSQQKALTAFANEVSDLKTHLALAEAEREDARRLAALTAEQEAANAQIIVATRQMFNDANARLRHLLLAALGMEDDDRTALVQYIHKLIAERDQLASICAEIGDAISPTGERPVEAIGTLAKDVRALAEAVNA